MMIQNGKRSLPLTNKPNRQKRKKELRSFSLVTSGMILLFFIILIPWVWGNKLIFLWPRILEKWPEAASLWPFDIAIWPFIIASTLSFFGLVAPMLLDWPFKIWMKFAEGLGWINSRIILTVVFYVLIMPMGLLMRLFGGDPMKKKPTKEESYRIVPSNRIPPKKHMERPF